MAQTLTDISIRALQPPTKGQVTVWDKSLKGFGVRISQGGTKSFVVVRGANRQRTTIGRFGVISLANARAEAKKLLAEHTLGYRSIAPITFDDAKKKYLGECTQKNRPKTVYDYTRILDRHFKFGRVQLAQISTRDVVNRVSRLSNTPRQQHYAFTVIKAFFRWAVRNRYLENSPVHDLSPPTRHQSREHTLSDAELKEVFAKAKAADSTFSNIIELLILTGQRRSEIAGLRWEWIDNGVITIPSTVTKNKRTHQLPLSKRAKAVLAAQPVTSDWVFPATQRIIRGQGSTFFNSWSKSKRDFDKSLKSVRPYTLHDLRRTFSTRLAELGTPIHVTERLLNHASGAVSGVAAIYNRYSYMEEMRTALEKLSKSIR